MNCSRVAPTHEGMCCERQFPTSQTSALVVVTAPLPSAEGTDKRSIWVKGYQPTFRDLVASRARLMQSSGTHLRNGSRSSLSLDRRRSRRRQDGPCMGIADC